MYIFTCPNDHKSFSAAKEQHEPGCPECGAKTRLVGEEADEFEPTAENVIWFPGIYQERGGDYAKTVMQFSDQQVIELVQKRAQQDGEWAIQAGVVGDNEAKMRKMMEWVSRPDNIRQAIAHLRGEGLDSQRTVDFLCRDLANASKWIGGGGARA